MIDWLVVPRSLVIYSMTGSRPTIMEDIDSVSQVTPFACCSETAQRCKRTGHQCSRMAVHRWSIGWREGTSRLHSFFDDVDALPPGMGLTRPAWVQLNRFRTGVGLFRSSMYKWGRDSTASCECGAEEQTADHILTSCPIYRHTNGIRGLLTVNESLARWLFDTCPAIWSDATSRYNIAPT